MQQQDNSFLGQFGDFLIDGLQATAALELQRRYAPNDDRVFTTTPAGPQPRGVPAGPVMAPTASSSADVLMLGFLGFIAWSFLK